MHPSIDLTTLESLDFEKICYFYLFICHVRETREHYQWRSKVDRPKYYFPDETFIDKLI